MKKLVADIEKIVSAMPGEHGPAADRFLVQVSTQTNTLRLTLYDKTGQPLGHYDCLSPDAYTLAAKINHGYDKLEGIA